MGVGRLVNPDAGQRVVHICQGDNLCGDRDILPDQTVRVAPAVIPLVVPAANFVGVFHQRFVLKGNPLHHVCTHLGVLLHDGKFLVGKPAWLVENLAGNTNFAYVVEGRRVADKINILPVQLVFIRFAGEALEQNLRHSLNVHNMKTALLIAKFNNVAEDGDHQVVDLLLLINLLVYHSLKPALLGIQHDGVNDTAAHHHHVEGPADVVSNAHIIGPLDKGVGTLCRNHNDGHTVDPVIFIHGRQYAEAVQIGHHNVQQDQRNLLLPLLEDGHRLQAVLRLDNVVGLLQHGAEDGAVHL